MRRTIDNTDPDWIAGKTYRVTVDGFELTRCIEADDQAGYAIVYNTGPDGSLIPVNGVLPTRKVYGIIRITEIV